MSGHIFKIRSHSEGRGGSKKGEKGKRGKKAFFAFFALFAFFASSSHSATEAHLTSPGGLPNIYVAPKGSPNGNGTMERQLDLATALAHRSPARPGATIWLRGGVYRGAFTSYLSGSSQSPITLRQYAGERATIDGAGNPGPPLTINGGYAIYHGFEVINSSADRVHERPTGVNVLGHHVKLINLVVRDNGIGIGFWAPAIDSEIYGCLIYRNGWQGPAPDRGHGHGVYGQNAEGMKRIVNNIIFDQYGYGIHNYTQAGELKGFHIEGNIIFNNGSTSTPNNAGYPNILVGGLRPAERITITSNYTYYTNTSTSASPFALTSQGKLATYPFTDWSHHTGYDRNSRLIRTATGRPTGLKIAALLNQYEAGRTNIVVYNWDLMDRVEVDVSGALRDGDRFEVRNALDFYGPPVLSGVYDGKPLRLPMAGSPVPEFGAFVLMK